MKLFITALITLASFTAIACPELSGIYMCNQGTVKINQVKANFVLHLGSSEYEFVADGSVIETGASSSYKNMTFTANCNDSAMTLVNEVFHNDGSIEGQHLTFSKQGTDLKMDTKYTDDQDGQHYEQSESEVCTRK